MTPFRMAAWTAAVFLELFRRPFPKIVRIETTNHCNARCIFCPHDTMDRTPGFMDEALYERIIGECALHPNVLLHLHNCGEPLMDERLPRMIRHAKKKGVGFVKVFSNGSLLQGDMAENLLSSGLNEIKISIDGANPMEFSRVRRGLDHTRIIENVKRFKQMRDSGNRDLPRITATCVLTSSRRASRAMLQDAVDNVVFGDIHNWGGESPPPKSKAIRQPCSRLWQTFTVLYTGEVALCHMDHAGKSILGHSRKQTICEIWNSPPYQRMRNLHRDSRQQWIRLCNNCSMSFFPPTFSYCVKNV